MNKNLNIKLFGLLVVFLVSFSYVWNPPGALGISKPWQLQPFEHEDSLSNYYKDNYLIYDKTRMLAQEKVSSNKKVVIVIDAWGVPVEESLLEQDFTLFDSLEHKRGIHQRLKNQTKHAERVEFRNEFGKGLFLFGGDSVEYNRRSYVPMLGYDSLFFCQKCSDSIMVAYLDSALWRQDFAFYALTTQDSRMADRASLHKTLNHVAKIAKRHKDFIFIVTGSHRPILGDAKERNSYKAHWVPVVILNVAGER
jgi:hypothetical protein